MKSAARAVSALATFGCTIAVAGSIAAASPALGQCGLRSRLVVFFALDQPVCPTERPRVGGKVKNEYRGFVRGRKAFHFTFFAVSVKVFRSVWASSTRR